MDLDKCNMSFCVVCWVVYGDSHSYNRSYQPADKSGQDFEKKEDVALNTQQLLKMQPNLT